MEKNPMRFCCAFTALVLLFMLCLVSKAQAQEAAASAEAPHANANIQECQPYGGSPGYLLYIPADAKPNMPLILYLHGGSSKGSDPNLLTAANGFPKFLAEGRLGDVPAYVLMPQLPDDAKGWLDVLDDLSMLLDRVCTAYQINTDKVSITGHSMGGTGAWAIAAAMPERFSCALPMSGSIRTTSDNIKALSGLPIWAFVGENDTIVSPAATLQFVDALDRAGANVKLTILPDADHFDVPNIYLDEDLSVVNWMIDQCRRL